MCSSACARPGGAILAISGPTDIDSSINVFDLVTETLRRSLCDLAQRTDHGLAANGLGFIAGFDAALLIGDSTSHLMPDCSV